MRQGPWARLIRVLLEGYVGDSWRWSGGPLVWLVYAFQGIVITWKRGDGCFSQRRLCLQSFSAQSLIPITQAPGGGLVERGHVIMTTMICRDIYSFRWCHEECTYACECRKDCSVMMRLTHRKIFLLSGRWVNDIQERKTLCKLYRSAFILLTFVFNNQKCVGKGNVGACECSHLNPYFKERFINILQ